MATYTIPLIWIVGAVSSDYIAGKRGVKKTVLRTIFFALFGPLAIPFVYLMQPEKTTHSD